MVPWLYLILLSLLTIAQSLFFISDARFFIYLCFSFVSSKDLNSFYLNLIVSPLQLRINARQFLFRFSKHYFASVSAPIFAFLIFLRSYSSLVVLRLQSFEISSIVFEQFSSIALKNQFLQLSLRILSLSRSDIFFLLSSITLTTLLDSSPLSF